MKYFMQPKVMNENLKKLVWAVGCRAIPQAVKDDAAFWLKSDMPCLLPLCGGGRAQSDIAAGL